MDIVPEPVMFNPFEPGFAADPYAQYARVRADGRVHRNPLGLRVLSHYDDCFELLRLPGTSVNELTAPDIPRMPLPPDLAEAMEQRTRSMLNLDPPDHTRLRRLVSSAFTVRRVERLRERARELAGELLDDVAEAGRDGEPVDLIARFAFPLPFVVISELLGMPEADRMQMRSWSHEMTKLLEPFTEEATLRNSMAVGELMYEHILDAIEWKRRNPADDLLSALIAAEEDGDRLSPEELVDQVVLLYLAGHETTVNLIGNGTCALLHHRDQLERLVADPGLDANAVDELLRYDSPVQLSRRIVPPPRSRSRARPSTPARWCSPSSARPTATRTSGARPPPTSTSAGRAPAPTSRSAAASTTASAPRWPGWRAPRPCPPWCGASPPWRWRPTSRPGTAASSSAGWTSCLWRWRAERPAGRAGPVRPSGSG